MANAKASQIELKPAISIIPEVVLVTEELTKVEELKQDSDVLAPSDDTEIKENATEKSEDIQEDEEETQDEGDVKHLVKYMGNGIWVDNNGIPWAKNHPNKDIISSMVFTTEEFEKRSDIQFMIQYGAMEYMSIK